MSRIFTPESIELALPEAKDMLLSVKKNLGVVPNLFLMVSSSPTALEGYLNLSEALGKGKIAAATRERIALAVAEINGCSYCLSAHTYLGKKLAKLSDDEIAANRKGKSNDPKADAAVRFAVTVVNKRGHIQTSDLDAIKNAGYDDGQILEIVLHVALNTWTNYINEIAQTEIDFPVVQPNKN
ncbi:peroxidase-related enzyme [Pigmentibacter sp. JX0631]|uniref:carboxymuconolactone decarboxylase family protein n=1 Tax=Pigmentibacter sp. JX0631 TaxID=2976982 RepID=UPI002468CEBD|nr:peroxidase-related enzyme [Pigmentibacter sp. JX0631]WGL59792.1 peroxidase-related enzyme [Pigmentibacter sp. JX0631]